jgi:hypothetical protein
MRPKHKDIDVQLVTDLRRMLTGAGYGDSNPEYPRFRRSSSLTTASDRYPSRA